jgi:hypothetical protein
MKSDLDPEVCVIGIWHYCSLYNESDLELAYSYERIGER